MIFTLRLDDEEATRRLGEDLALALAKGDLITLHGDLGAGKSALARAVIRTIADDETLDVPSPTFTLVQSYDDQRLTMTHADLYRIGNPEEVEELGLGQARAEGILLVEWLEKAEGLLDDPQFAVFLKHDGTGRLAAIRAEQAAAERLERSFRIRGFLQKNRRGKAVRRYLAGDASPRGYEILTLGDACEILMDAPETIFIDEAWCNYAQTSRLAIHVNRFTGIDRLLRENGFTAPEIRASDPDTGLLILENLGQTGIVDDAGLPIAERYLACAEMLADFHEIKWPEHKSWSDLILDIPPYDRNALHAEVALLPEWYMLHVVQRQPDATMRKTFHDCWEMLFNRLLRTETSLVLRDFHSPNILWQARRKGNRRIGLIDFQDAVTGPAAYDLVSLAQDARVTIPETLETAIIGRYKAARRQAGFDEAAFDEAYAIAGAQRASKILGAFVRLDRRDGKPHYLKHLPRINGYLRRNLKAPALQKLKACYRQIGILPRDL